MKDGPIARTPDESVNVPRLVIDWLEWNGRPWWQRLWLRLTGRGFWRDV